MLNINNNAANIKREILVRIAKAQLEGKLEEVVQSIPMQIAPIGSKSVRCCIYHDREILRMRILARLGWSVEDYVEDRSLAEYAKEALKREKPTEPLLTVLHTACNSCVRSHYMVTNACQGCFARPCMTNCPKKAIQIEHHAYIDPEKCINCGLCMQNCPYHAIIKIPVPCEEACPVGAIFKDEFGNEKIDFDKCILCGNCMRECPFGAMMDKSQLVDVIKHILSEKKVVALYAPAIAGQSKLKTGQLENALKTAGFDEVMEVAIGADICADKEYKEFEERMERGDKMMTTSCCSAYVRAVNLHVPTLKKCVSDTKSPMHYTAKIAKEKFADCITVFIGPCLAKRSEGLKDEYVDYVVSMEEINALFIAKEINPAEMEISNLENLPTSSARNFAISSGVANAVKTRLKDSSIFKPVVINGLNKIGMKTLEMYGKINEGSIPTPDNCPNMIEVMACEGGCVGGPSAITNSKTASVLIKQYVNTGNTNPSEFNTNKNN